VYQGENGMVILRGRLAPEVGAVLVQALAAAREALYQPAREKDANASPASPSSKTARTVPRKRLGVSRATRAGW